MSDWEVINQDNPENASSSEWEIAPIDTNAKPQEGLGESIVKAPFRVGEDVIKGGYKFLKNIPNYIEQAKSEIPGSVNVLSKHPKSGATQALAGLSELGQNVFNTPHDIVNYMANRLNLVPESINQKVQMGRMPSDTQQMINQTFGEPKEAGESLIRGAARNAINLLGGKKIASTLNPMNLTAKNIAKDIVNTHNQNKNIYSNLYTNLWKEAKTKGLDNLSHVAPKIDIKTLRKYSPSKSIAGIEDFLKNKNIQTAHNAKSDLLRIKRDLEKLPTLKTAERKQMKAASDAIDQIQKNMFKSKSGKVDHALADKYNKIQKGYSEEVVPYKNKAINKFRRNEMSAKELVNALSRGEFMAKRGKHHPEIGFRNAFRNHPYLTGAGFGGVAKMIYDNIMNDQATEQ